MSEFFNGTTLEEIFLEYFALCTLGFFLWAVGVVVCTAIPRRVDNRARLYKIPEKEWFFYNFCSYRTADGAFCVAREGRKWVVYELTTPGNFRVGVTVHQVDTLVQAERLIFRLGGGIE